MHLYLGFCIWFVVFTSDCLAMLPWPEQIGDSCEVRNNGVVDLSESDLAAVRRTRIAWLEQQDKLLRIAEERFRALQVKDLPIAGLRKELTVASSLVTDLWEQFDGVTLSCRNTRHRRRYERIREVVDSARFLMSRIMLFESRLDDVEKKE